MLAFRLLRRKKSLPSVSNNTVSSSFIFKISKQPKISTISAVFLYLAPWRGLEPPVYRLGGGCVIHYATRAYSLVSIRLSALSDCSIPRLGGGRSIQLSYWSLFTSLFYLKYALLSSGFTQSPRQSHENFHPHFFRLFKFFKNPVSLQGV